MTNEENKLFNELEERNRVGALKFSFGFLGIIFVGLFILAAFINVWAALLGGVSLSFLGFLRFTWNLSNVKDKKKIQEVEKSLNAFRVDSSTKIAFFVKKSNKKK